MIINKRSLPKYILLNCLTLGIYGFIVNIKMGKEIDALCDGDSEKPRFGYVGAVMFRGLAILVAIACFLLSIVIVTGGTISSFFSLDLSDIIGEVAMEFAGDVFDDDIAYMLGDMFGLGNSSYLNSIGNGVASYFWAGMIALLGIVALVVCNIYYRYWWYKQANRLKLNAGRYNLVINESGTDNFLFRTVVELLFLPLTLILFCGACLIPGILIGLLVSTGQFNAFVFAIILAVICSIPLLLFGMELTAGANFSMFFMFKNMNRFAEVYQGGALPFDPMGYEYYPSHESMYPNYLPDYVNGNWKPEVQVVPNDGPGGGSDGPHTDVVLSGTLVGVKGTCAGYAFTLNPGEEVIIGKDARVASVVIDPAYKEVSRKHVGVMYDAGRDQYRVVDYSSNGTWANGSRLTAGQPVYLPHGTELKLANGKNIFHLN